MGLMLERVRKLLDERDGRATYRAAEVGGPYGDSPTIALTYISWSLY